MSPLSVPDLVQRAEREYRRRFGPQALLESPLQALVELEQRTLLRAAFDALERPAAADRRWLGVGLLLDGDTTEGATQLEAALAGGVVGAGLDLAQHLVRRGNLTAAQARLEAVQDAERSERDRLLERQVRGELALALDQPRRVLEELETPPPATRPAAQLRGLAREGQCVRAQALLALGRAAHAQSVLDRVLEDLPEAQRRAAHALRAEALLGQGRLGEAEGALRLAALGGGTAPRPGTAATQARVHLAWGRLEQAHAACAEARVQAQVQGQARLELHLTLLEAGLEASLGRGDPGATLKQAGRLANTEGDRLRVLARQTLVRQSQGTAPNPEGLSRLAESFAQRGLAPEEAEVRLARVAALSTRSEAEAQQELARLEALQAAHPLSPLLLWAWPLWPQVQPFVTAHAPTLVPQVGDIVELLSLDLEQVTVAGEPLRVPMRRVHELLIYLQAHRQATLHQILADVFEGEPIQRARNYLHQMRHLLKHHTPLLEIDFSGLNKTYRLSSPLPIRWDVDLVRQGVVPLEGRVFMPGGDSDWGERVAQTLV